MPRKQSKIQNPESKMRYPRILVTGGAGFIGSHLSERLLAEGHEVIIIDDLSTGRLQNIEHLEDNPRFESIIDSCDSEPLLLNVVENVDAIFHLASGVGVMSVVHSPVHTPVLVLAAAAAQPGAGKKVLITSSSEVYGKGTKVPFSEEDDMLFGPTTKARWSYGCSKALDEFLALAYHKEQRLPVVITRLFNTVGPRQVGKFGMVLPRFVEQALSGGPIEVFGDGEQTRCFCDVSDVVGALYRLMHSDACDGKVMNLGSDDEISMNALAARVRARVNPQAAIVHIPYEKAYEEGFEDLRRRVPDLTRVRSLIGFKPAVPLDGIIDRVAEDLRSRTRRIE